MKVMRSIGLSIIAWFESDEGFRMFNAVLFSLGVVTLAVGVVQCLAK